MSRLAGWPRRIVEDAAASLRTVPDLYLLREWIVRLVSDPSVARTCVRRSRGSLPWCSELRCCWNASRPSRCAGPPRALRQRAPDPAEAAGRENGAWHRLRRLPAAAARLGLELVPVAIFWIAATLLAGFVPVPLTRMAIAIAINAYIAIRVILAIGHMLLAPRGERLAAAAYR